MDQNRRLEFHEILVDILGTRNVYFQPPQNIEMKYPCIVYNRDTADQKYANNGLYLRKLAYEVTYIDRDPDADAPDALLGLPLCRYGRHFQTEGLHHDTFTIYY